MPDTNEPKAPSVVREQESFRTKPAHPPTLILTGKLNDDGSFDLRTDTVAREKPDADGKPGANSTSGRPRPMAKDMINNGEGQPLPSLEDKKKKRAEEDSQKRH